MPLSSLSHSQHNHQIPLRRPVSHREEEGEAGTGRHTRTELQFNRDETSFFVVDRKGDRRNLEYGAPDRYSVPRYRSAGRGSVIGLARNYRVTDASQTLRVVEDIEIDSSRRSQRHSLLAQIPHKDDKQIIITVPATRVDFHDDQDIQRDFIPFVDSHRRKCRRLSESSESISSEGEGSGASASELGGKALDDYLDVFDAFKNDPIHQRQLQLSKATVNSPKDVQVWLDLIKHQEISFLNQNKAQLPGSNSLRSLADIKISLYREALEQVKDQEGREILIKGLMQEGTKVWDVHKQITEWDFVLQSYHSVKLWTLYLNFKQTNALDYNSEECLKVYKRFLHITHALEPGIARDESSVYVVLRLSLYLWQVDMTELAIGLWQALLELAFCSPLNQSPHQLLASFQKFWDSESARIGEDKANGWGADVSAEVSLTADQKLEKNHDIDLAAWAQIETDLWRTSSLPARSLDETNDEDPYRIVLFSDIETFLFYPTTKEGAILLMDAFLIFCGLDPMSSLSAAGRWQTDPFIYSHFPSSRSSRMSPLSTSDTSKPRDGHPTILESTTNNTEYASLISAATFPFLICPSFIRRILSQLTRLGHEVIPRDIIMQYVISLEASIDLKVTRKQAKSFLKSLPNSLRLYNSYALIECQLGNFELAEKVWSTALSMQTSQNPPKDHCTSIVWRDWAWSYMSKRRFSSARLLLTSIPDGQLHLSELHLRKSDPAVAAQLKAERFLALELEAGLSAQTERKPYSLVALIDLLAFHMYLNHDFQLEKALQVYSKYLLSIERLAAGWLLEIVELVHERRATLLHAHATAFGRPFKPKQLFATLTESIHKFPDNCSLLWKQHIYGQQSGAMDRLRALDIISHDYEYEQSNHMPLSVASTCLDVCVEIARPSYSGSTNHSIRAAFQRAVGQGSSGMYCVSLWKSYVLWELSIAKPTDKTLILTPGQVKKAAQNTKDVFHAALKACPWAKEIYMLAFQERLLRSAFAKEELKHLYHSVVERGLRMRFDISDNVI